MFKRTYFMQASDRSGKAKRSIIAEYPIWISKTKVYELMLEYFTPYCLVVESFYVV